MATNHGESDVVIMHCPMYGCDGEMEIRNKDYASGVCPTCECPMWPHELGYVGNDRDRVKEFARTHNRDGSFAGDEFESSPVRNEIMKYLGILRREASLEETQLKLDRLAFLNLRSTGALADDPLTAEEEVERRFLSLTLPHASRRGEISDLLNLF
ncbi:MAG: hypothetical protein JWN50_526 [Parcubacteria group bacterium]|nr:hypothetical protein [Parcubacteria group bacterium]